MITGTGTLILRDGLRIAVTYQFGSDYDDCRVGYLHCDTRSVDPAAFGDRLKVLCDDGTAIVVAVMHHSDKCLGVTGRVLAEVVEEAGSHCTAAAAGLRVRAPALVHGPACRLPLVLGVSITPMAALWRGLAVLG